MYIYIIYKHYKHNIKKDGKKHYKTIITCGRGAGAARAGRWARCARWVGCREACFRRWGEPLFNLYTFRYARAERSFSWTLDQHTPLLPHPTSFLTPIIVGYREECYVCAGEGGYDFDVSIVSTCE